MIFDQYSRYKCCADLLDHYGFDKQHSVLDAGSGPLCLFEQFFPDADWTFVDPLIKNPTKSNRIEGTIFSHELDDKKFFAVTCVDVYEHIPEEERPAFLDRIQDLSEEFIILGFPASDLPGSKSADDTNNALFKKIYNKDYSWLDEHYNFGLPSEHQTIETLEKNGWFINTLHHSNAAWLSQLLSLVICYNEDPNCHDAINTVSKKFNEELYPYDFAEPCYRTFIVASRHPVKAPPTTSFSPKELREADALFQKIKNEFLDNVRFQPLRSLKQLQETVEHLQESAAPRQQSAEYLQNDLTEMVPHLERKVALLESEIRALNARETNRYTMKGLLKTIIGIFAKTALGQALRNRRTLYASFKEGQRIKSISRALKRHDGRLVITLPIIDWDFRTQRPQHLNAQLASNNNVIIYLRTMLQPSRPISRTKQKRWVRNTGKSDLKIYEMQLPCKEPHNIYGQILDGDNLQTVVESLENIISEVTPNSIHILVQFPSWWPLASLLREKFGGKIIFDCMDDIKGFSNISTEVINAERDAVTSSDLVLASSLDLFEKCGALNPNTVLVRNAAEFEHFNTATKNGKLDHLLGKPIIGYYGAIAEWFDQDIIEYCAKNNPNWHFVLIGAMSNIDSSRFDKLSNIHQIGEIPYDQLPGYVAYFDVATIPFKLNSLTQATNPVKFYEYLSAGLPVVSTKLPELMEYEGHCWLANNKEDFLECLQAALQKKDNADDLKEYYRIGKGNSWEQRAKTIIESAPYLG